jgi:hypothetical protein
MDFIGVLFQVGDRGGVAGQTVSVQSRVIDEDGLHVE